MHCKANAAYIHPTLYIHSQTQYTAGALHFKKSSNKGRWAPFNEKLHFYNNKRLELRNLAALPNKKNKAQTFLYCSLIFFMVNKTQEYWIEDNEITQGMSLNGNDSCDYHKWKYP